MDNIKDKYIVNLEVQLKININSHIVNKLLILSDRTGLSMQTILDNITDRLEWLANDYYCCCEYNRLDIYNCFKNKKNGKK